MTHLAEGTLQAFLDDEITGRERVAAAEHLLMCAECRAELDGLKGAHARLSAALAELDVTAPEVAPPRALRRRGRSVFPGGSLARAAVLVLMVAAAASASVPGSPVRDWIVQAVRPADTAPAPVPTAPAVVESAEAVPPSAPAGIALPGIRELDIVVTGLEDTTIRLSRTDAGGVAVSARGGVRDPLFRMASGRIEVAGGAGGELVIEVPRDGASVRLVVDGRRYAEVVGDQLRVLEPAAQDGEAVVWR